MTTLEASRQEMRRRLDEFVDVLSIKSSEVDVTEQKLGSGAFAGELIDVHVFYLYNDMTFRGLCWSLAWNDSCRQKIPRSDHQPSQRGPVSTRSSCV